MMMARTNKVRKIPFENFLFTINKIMRKSQNKIIHTIHPFINHTLWNILPIHPKFLCINIRIRFLIGTDNPYIFLNMMDNIIKIHYLKNFNQKWANWCNTKKYRLLHATVKKANVSNYIVNVLQIIG